MVQPEGHDPSSPRLKAVCFARLSYVCTLARASGLEPLSQGFKGPHPSLNDAPMAVVERLELPSHVLGGRSGSNRVALPLRPHYRIFKWR